MRVWLLLLLPLAGCMDASSAACDATDGLLRGPGLPRLEPWNQDDQHVAQTFAAALGTEITSGPERVQLAFRWHTPNGTIDITEPPVERSVTFTTSKAWTPWDGSTMEQDLAALVTHFSGNETFAKREQGHEDPPAAGATWQAFEQHIGRLPMGAVFSINMATQGEASFQQVSWDETYDTSGVVVIGDDELQDLAVAHLECAGYQDVVVTPPHDALVLHELLHVRVAATFEGACGPGEANIILDAQTGWAHVEPGLTCPT